eukprot:scaffold6405_cov390-Prasinococcus_capsulatus_cf.AAC.1
MRRACHPILSRATSEPAACDINTAAVCARPRPAGRGAACLVVTRNPSQACRSPRPCADKLPLAAAAQTHPSARRRPGRYRLVRRQVRARHARLAPPWRGLRTGHPGGGWLRLGEEPAGCAPPCVHARSSPCLLATRPLSMRRQLPPPRQRETRGQRTFLEWMLRVAELQEFLEPELLQVDQFARVLNVGCGTSDLSYFLAQVGSGSWHRHRMLRALLAGQTCPVTAAPNWRTCRKAGRIS